MNCLKVLYVFLVECRGYGNVFGVSEDVCNVVEGVETIIVLHNKTLSNIISHYQYNPDRTLYHI